MPEGWSEVFANSLCFAWVCVYEELGFLWGLLCLHDPGTGDF